MHNPPTYSQLAAGNVVKIGNHKPRDYQTVVEKGLLYYDTCTNEVSGLFAVLCTDMPLPCLALLATSYPTERLRRVTKDAW